MFASLRHFEQLLFDLSRFTKSESVHESRSLAEEVHSGSVSEHELEYNSGTRSHREEESEFLSVLAALALPPAAPLKQIRTVAACRLCAP